MERQWFDDTLSNGSLSHERECPLLHNGSDRKSIRLLAFTHLASLLFITGFLSFYFLAASSIGLFPAFIHCPRGNFVLMKLRRKPRRYAAARSGARTSVSCRRVAVGSPPAICTRCPVEGVCRHKISHTHAVARNELPAFHVLFQHRCHVFELTARQDHVLGQTPFFRIERRMARDAPQRLLQLRRREQ